MQDIQRPLRDAPNDLAQEKNVAAAYLDYECGSDLSRTSGVGRRVVDEGQDKSWSLAGNNLAEKLSGQRNGFNNKLGYENYPAPKSANTGARLLPMQKFSSGSSNRVLSTNWKNSEEEEFMWGEMNSMLTGHGAPAIASGTGKDQCTPEDSDNSVSLDIIDGDHFFLVILPTTSLVILAESKRKEKNVCYILSTLVVHLSGWAIMDH